MDRGDENLCHVLPAADLLQLGQHCLRFLPHPASGESSTQSAEHHRAVVGKRKCLPQCSHRLGMPSRLCVCQAEIEISWEKIRVQFQISVSLLDRLVVPPSEIALHRHSGI